MPSAPSAHEKGGESKPFCSRPQPMVSRAQSKSSSSLFAKSSRFGAPFEPQTSSKSFFERPAVALEEDGQSRVFLQTPSP